MVWFFFCNTLETKVAPDLSLRWRILPVKREQKWCNSISDTQINSKSDWFCSVARVCYTTELQAENDCNLDFCGGKKRGKFAAEWKRKGRQCQVVIWARFRRLFLNNWQWNINDGVAWAWELTKAFSTRGTISISLNLLSAVCVVWQAALCQFVFGLFGKRSADALNFHLC